MATSNRRGLSTPRPSSSKSHARHRNAADVGANAAIPGEPRASKDALAEGRQQSRLRRCSRASDKKFFDVAAIAPHWPPNTLNIADPCSRSHRSEKTLTRLHVVDAGK